MTVGQNLPRTVTVLTTGRQDWGILRSTCVAMSARDDLRVDLVAAGMHLSKAHGRTVELVRADGFDPTELAWVVEARAGADPEGDVDRQAASALQLIGRHLRLAAPTTLLVVGDRFEVAAAALAATSSRTPIIHLHGGEQTLGAIDDALRHAITKLAHLHLVSSELHRQTVIALGEDPGAVRVVGAPGLDGLFRPDLPDRRTLEHELGIKLAPPVVLVTVHPETLATDPLAAAAAVGEAMRSVPATYLVTLPNVDPGGDQARSVMDAAGVASRATILAALGDRRYWGLLKIADAMLGNSSSGIIEAPAVKLPAVNVGDRQGGRERAANAIDVPSDPEAVVAGLLRALDPAFRGGLPAMDPKLVDGRAGERVANIIAAWQPPRPPHKPPIQVGLINASPS